MTVARTLGCLLIAAVAAAPAAKRETSVPAQVARWMRSLSLRDRVAQLILVPTYGEAPGVKSDAYKKYHKWVHNLRVGGVIVLGRNQNGTIRNAEPFAMAAFFNRLQRQARIPLIVGADFERGASMRVLDTVKFPHNMAFAAAGDPAASRFEGAFTAREARALGVQWVFAPVADVNNNPDNPIINIRSFGENPEEVARYVAAFIDGAHSEAADYVLVTAKHFPGHGDTSTDSHLGLARVDADRARLEKVEFTPFRAAIQHHVDAIMTAHIAVPALEPEEIPATVSSKILTGVLRDELGFRGLIVTDALDMRGFSDQFDSGEGAVRALEAGADVLLMPDDPEKSIRAVLAAIKRGRLTRRRIDQSVSRVLAAKVRVGLARRKLVNLETINDTLQDPDAAERAQAVADRAVTLVRNQGDLVPLRHPDSTCAVVLGERRNSQEGFQFLAELRKRAPAMKTILLDPSMPDVMLDYAADQAAGCDAVVVATYVAASAYRGNVALPGNFPALVEKLTAGKAPVIFISFGNPYLLRSFPGVAAYIATFSTVATSETAAVKALFGEIPITGHLPVTIPGLAAYGEGIQLPARVAKSTL